MSLSYDIFVGAFLQKITEYDFVKIAEPIKTSIADGYMKSALTSFRKNCKYDLFTTCDDETRSFDVEIEPEDIDEIVEIVSEGMIVQWMKPYINHQDDLENYLNTRDFSVYSPAELLYRKRNAYKQAQKDFMQLIREYSFNHNDLEDLHI